MTVLLACLQIAAFLAIAVACLVPRARRLVAILFLVLGAAALTQAARAGDAQRTLAISTTFPAYKGLNVARKDFQVDHAAGAAWEWGLLCGVFVLAWAGWAWRYRNAPPSRAAGAPLALAWSGCGLILLLEKAAAPAALVAPFDWGPDRALIPATLAAALLLARQKPRVLDMVLSLTLFVAATRAALGLFATFATLGGWGTHLDIRSIDFIAIGTEPVELAPGSLRQWWWLLGVPHLVVFPAIYMMSMGGIAFGVMMAAKQRQVDQPAEA